VNFGQFGGLPGMALDSARSALFERALPALGVESQAGTEEYINTRAVLLVGSVLVGGTPAVASSRGGAGLFHRAKQWLGQRLGSVFGRGRQWLGQRLGSVFGRGRGSTPAPGAGAADDAAQAQNSGGPGAAAAKGEGAAARPIIAGKDLPKFPGDLQEAIVANARLAKGKTTRAQSLLEKRTSEGAITGVKPTQANAEQIISDVLGNPSRARGTERLGQLDLIGESFGQEVAIRINLRTGQFIRFGKVDF
jgi:hypothetical protein